MKNRENSLADTYRLRYVDYVKWIGLKIKEIFFSTQAQVVVEILTLLAVIFAFSQSQGLEDIRLNSPHLLWILLLIVYVIQNWKSIKNFFLENIG